jgi:hypothetical protein
MSAAARVLEIPQAAIEKPGLVVVPAAVLKLLNQFQSDIERAGLVGEKENARIIFLSALTAKLAKPLNVSIHGVSSAGKNHLMYSVAKFLPSDMVKFLSGMSPKALMHSGEDEFQHKAVFIAEYEGVSGADYAIRTFQSEGEIQWDFVTHDGDKGLCKKTNKVKGPCAFIQATTRSVLHPENETRLLFVEMDETEEQTRAINERQALGEDGTIEEPDPELFAWWHRLVGGLEPSPLIVPFARQLVQHFPGKQPRSRRDFPKLMGLIKASAFLQQSDRERDSRGQILANEEDYRIGRELFLHCYSAGPEKALRELLRTLPKLRDAEFNVPELMEATRWGQSKTYEVLARAQELGHVAHTDRRGYYKLLGEVRDHPTLALPEVLE